MTAIASTRAARRGPNSPSAPGAATRLAATAAARSAPQRKSCLPEGALPEAPFTRSARGLGSGHGRDGQAGADQPAVDFGAHLLGDDMRVDRVPDHRRTDEQDQFGPRPRGGLMRERIAKRARKLIEPRNALPLLVFGLG